LCAAPFHAADPAPPVTEVPKVNYVYNAKVVRVLDGATVALNVDLGFHMWVHNQVFLLQGVTAPPPDAPDKAAAMQAKTRVQELLQVDDEVVLQSIRDKNDKSGAYHAVIWKDGVNINGKLGTL
jgi:endonuclease YncB( thermonuclease family)